MFATTGQWPGGRVALLLLLTALLLPPVAGLAAQPVCDAPARLRAVADQRAGHALIDAELNNAALLLCLMKAVRAGRATAPVRGWLDRAFLQLGELLLDTDRPEEAARIARSWWTLVMEGERPPVERQRAELKIARLLEAGGYGREATAHLRSVVAGHGDDPALTPLSERILTQLTAAPDPDRATLCGTAVLADGPGKPLLAQLWHHGTRQRVWVDDHGDYCLTLPPRAGGDLAYVILSASGHRPSVTPITVRPGETLHLPGVTLARLERPELGMVAGFAFVDDGNGGGRPLAGVTLSYTGEEGRFEAVTDGSGVALVAIPSGEYRFVGGADSVVVRASRTVLGPHPQRLSGGSEAPPAAQRAGSDRAELGLSP